MTAATSRAAPSPVRRPVPAFVALLLALSVPFWIAGAVVADPDAGLAVDLPVSALMFVCPLLAAVALTWRSGGTGSVRRLLRRATDIDRIRPRILLVPLLGLLPAVTTASWLVLGALGRPLPAVEAPVGAVVGFTLLYLVSTACEQLGWTAYATDAMLRGHDALTTALVLGGVWAAWHVIPYVQAGHDVAWIAGQCAFTVALRVVLTSAYLATHRSVAATILVQATADLSWTLFPAFGSHYDPVVTGAILVVVAGLITVAWGRRTLAPPSRGPAGHAVAPTSPGDQAIT